MFLFSTFSLLTFLSITLLSHFFLIGQLLIFRWFHWFSIFSISDWLIFFDYFIFADVVSLHDDWGVFLIFAVAFSGPFSANIFFHFSSRRFRWLIVGRRLLIFFHFLRLFRLGFAFFFAISFFFAYVQREDYFDFDDVEDFIFHW